MSSDVHGEGAGTATESVALGSVLASVAHLAEELVLVLVGVGRVQKLVAQACRSKMNDGPPLVVVVSNRSVTGL